MAEIMSTRIISSTQLYVPLRDSQEKRRAVKQIFRKFSFLLSRLWSDRHTFGDFETTLPIRPSKPNALKARE